MRKLSLAKGNQKSPTGRVAESGVYLVLLALFLSFLAVFAAAFIGMAFLSSTRVEQQNISNLAAMSCLNAYIATVQVTDAFGNTKAAEYLDKATACQTSAEQTVKGSKELGVLDPTTFTTCFASKNGPTCPPDADLTITLGNYYTADDPASPQVECDDGLGSATYPCFEVINDPPDVAPVLTSANAAKVVVYRKEDSHPISRFLTSGKDLTDTATVTIVPKCVAFLIDISGSTALDTYGNVQNMVGGGAGQPTYYLPKPPWPGLVAFSTDFVTNPPTCDAAANDPSWNTEKIIWCNMDPLRPDPNDLLTLKQPYPFWHPLFGVPGAVGYESANDPLYPTYHYHSDYIGNPVTKQPYGGSMLVDRYRDLSGQYPYTGAEPFASFMLAFNASLRAIKSIASNADHALVYPFSAAARFPEPTYGMYNSTQELDLLIQLTNLDNGGYTDWNGNLLPDPLNPKIIRPNYLDKGWFVLNRPGQDNDSATNLVGALDDTIARMAAACPTTSRKSIILGTDGISTCWLNPAVGYDCTNPSYGVTYSGAQSDLLGRILNNLKQNDISLTVLLAGQSVRPHIKNEFVPNSNPAVFMNSQEAKAYGYWGGNIAPNNTNKFVDSSSKCSNPGTPTDPGCAYDEVPKTGSYFGDAGAAMADLAFASGGDYCPLLPVCSDTAVAPDPRATNSPCTDANGQTVSCYQPDPLNPTGPYKLVDSARYPPGSVQTCSIYNQSLGQQAAACAKNAINSNSIILVDNNVVER